MDLQSEPIPPPPPPKPSAKTEGPSVGGYVTLFYPDGTLAVMVTVAPTAQNKFEMELLDAPPINVSPTDDDLSDSSSSSPPSLDSYPRCNRSDPSSENCEPSRNPTPAD